MAKPQKSTAQSEVPGLVKKGPLYYLKRDWQLYALMLLPMVFIIVFKYFAYTGLSVAFLDYKIGKGYAGSKFVGLKIFEKVFKHRDFTKAVVNTLLLNVLDLIFSFPMPIILALLLNEIHHALLGPLPGSGPNFYAKQPLQGTVPAPTRQRPRKVYTIC